MIEVDSLSITLGSFRLRDVHLSVQTGEYVVVMGPTGSGKTVLLECLVGLYTPSSGHIRINGRDIMDSPPERRGLAYVPQDYCLFPHMTLRGNIAYGMRLRRFPARRQAETIERLAELLGLGAVLDRRPLHLSGGERQRGALARALAIEPDVLLLDEPLSAVDQFTRRQLCGFMKRLQREIGVTTVHVCHDLDEALSLADRIAVFGNGTILQQAEPSVVLSRPSSVFVARCVGSGNVIPGRGILRDGQLLFECDGIALPFEDVPQARCHMAIRPEHVRVADRAAPHAHGWLPATVADRQDRGALIWLELRLGGLSLQACVPASDSSALQPRPGSEVLVSIPQQHVCFMLS